MMVPAPMYMPSHYRPTASLNPGGELWPERAGGQLGIWRIGTFVTRPALMQLVHTCRRVGEPFTRARTFCTLGFQRRLVRTWECDTDMPKDGFLPQS